MESMRHRSGVIGLAMDNDGRRTYLVRRIHYGSAEPYYASFLRPWHVLYGIVPRAKVMGVVGIAALIANGGVALMLYRFRAGDANMRSVWICSRNDAVGNAAVLLAAMGVFGTGTGWPDVIVAAIMGGLGLWGGCQIVRQAQGELRSVPTGEVVAAE